jgi:hypothetical protein
VTQDLPVAVRRRDNVAHDSTGPGEHPKGALVFDGAGGRDDLGQRLPSFGDQHRLARPADSFQNGQTCRLEPGYRERLHASQSTMDPTMVTAYSQVRVPERNPADKGLPGGNAVAPRELVGRRSKCYRVSMTQVQARIAQHEFAFDAAEIVQQLRDTMPEPLGDHYVVVGGKRFPPKQVISLVTGLDRADFNTHQARRILSRLGFIVGRRSKSPPAAPDRPGPHRGREADLLRPFAGQWVAQRGLEVLVAADAPQAVLGWLERHNQQADAMFRVPLDESEATGVAPG